MTEITTDTNLAPTKIVEFPKKKTNHRLVKEASRLFIDRILVLIGALLLWQGLVAIGWANPFFVSEPVSILKRLGQVVGTADLYVDMAYTMQNVLIGFGISAAAGIATACLLYRFQRVQKILDPYILALYSTPRLALAPLFIVWFGIGAESKIALVISLCYFPMLLNTYAGLKNVDPRLVDQVRMMGGNGIFIFRRVHLPASVPWLLSGTRVGLGFALIGAVVGELIISEYGLGLRIARASGHFDTTGVFAYLIVIALLGMILDQVVGLTERLLSSYGNASGRS